MHRPFQSLLDHLFIKDNLNPLFSIYFLPIIYILLNLDKKDFLIKYQSWSWFETYQENFIFINSSKLLRFKKNDNHFHIKYYIFYIYVLQL